MTEGRGERSNEKKSKEKKFAPTILKGGTTENLGVHANRSVLNILALSRGFRNFDCRRSRSPRTHSQTYTRRERERKRKRERERERERNGERKGKRGTHTWDLSRLTPAPCPSPSAARVFSFTFSPQPSPDSRPPSSFRLVFFFFFFLEVRVATILRSRLFLAIGRPRSGGRGQRPRRVFSNPSAFKYSYQFQPFSSRSFELARPLELASVDQRTDTNRGCIQRALAHVFSLSVSPCLSVVPPSISSPAWT